MAQWLSDPNGSTFTYDDDGNQLTDGRWVYTWDGENRLIAMETKSGIGVSPMMRLVFAYDAQARRISKQVYTWANGSIWGRSIWGRVYTFDLNLTRFLFDY